jgi:RNA polymerase-binding transcription factor DksA
VLRSAHDARRRATTAQDDLHSIDSSEIAHEQMEHAEILSEMHAEEERLTEIEAALARIAAGTYGTCELTGKPISLARLRAMPWTRFSITAAQRREQAARTGRTA